LFAKTIEVFMVHLSSFPWLPDARTYFPCTGMTIASEQLRLLDKEKLPYTRANETSQGKFEKRFPLSEALQQVTLNSVYKSHSM
jgi:hypothetical protein